jgi:hypothetical protein
MSCQHGTVAGKFCTGCALDACNAAREAGKREGARLALLECAVELTLVALKLKEQGHSAKSETVQMCSDHVRSKAEHLP